MMIFEHVRDSQVLGGNLQLSLNNGHLEIGNYITINPNEVNLMGKPYDPDFKQQLFAKS